MNRNIFHSEMVKVQVVEPAKVDDSQGLEDPEAYVALQSLIPHFPGRNGWQKMQYLTYRATGFTFREACKLVGIKKTRVDLWRREDPAFRDFEINRLKELQHDASGEILRIEFLRNMRLALYRDFKVLFKAAQSLQALTPAEMQYLRLIRKHYTPQDLLALDKALAADDVSSTTSIGQVNVFVDGKHIESVEARRAMARELLEKFRVVGTAAQLLDQSDPIDGEARSIDAPSAG